MTAITSIDELKKLADSPDGFDGYILLAGGAARSSKAIWYDTLDDSWFIRHDIDESVAEYLNTYDFTTNETSIVQALNQGALYTYI